jgi:rhodanese-related sulfurtransferase
VLLIDVRTAAEVEENGIIESDNQMQIAIEDFIAMKDSGPRTRMKKSLSTAAPATAPPWS